MEKQLTPISQTIEVEKNILARYEALKFDKATISMQKAFIGRLESLLPTEREVIETVFNAGFDNILSGSGYFTETFKQEP